MITDLYHTQLVSCIMFVNLFFIYKYYMRQKCYNFIRIIIQSSHKYLTLSCPIYIILMFWKKNYFRTNLLFWRDYEFDRVAWWKKNQSDGVLNLIYCLYVIEWMVHVMQGCAFWCDARDQHWYFYSTKNTNLPIKKKHIK